MNFASWYDKPRFTESVAHVALAIAYYAHGVVQDRRNSSALAMELRLSCTNPYWCHLLAGNATIVGRLFNS